MQNKKGGKGKAKKGGPRTYYKCGSEDPIAAACLVRLAQVEACGPERLDKPDDAMKGGKGVGKNG